MNFEILYKNVGSKMVRMMVDEGYKTILKYGYIIKFRYKGSRNIKFKKSGYSFDSEQQARAEMEKFISSLNPPKPPREEDRIMSPEEAAAGFAEMRKKLGMPPYDPNKPNSFEAFSNAGGFSR